MWPVRSDNDVRDRDRGVSEPTDVIASSDTVLGTHGVDYVARREHVQLQGREGRLEVVPVFLPNTAIGQC